MVVVVIKLKGQLGVVSMSGLSFGIASCLISQDNSLMRQVRSLSMSSSITSLNCLGSNLCGSDSMSSASSLVYVVMRVGVMRGDGVAWVRMGMGMGGTPGELAKMGVRRRQKIPTASIQWGSSMRAGGARAIMFTMVLRIMRSEGVGPELVRRA